MRTIEVKTIKGTALTITEVSAMNYSINVNGQDYEAYISRPRYNKPVDRVGAYIGDNKRAIIPLASGEYDKLSAWIDEPYRAAREKEAERKRLEKEYDEMYNEGGEGYNPYRSKTYGHNELRYKSDDVED